jgi:hypothetical protein
MSHPNAGDTPGTPPTASRAPIYLPPPPRYPLLSSSISTTTTTQTTIPFLKFIVSSHPLIMSCQSIVDPANHHSVPRSQWLYIVMGCIPSKQDILETFDEKGPSTSKGRTARTKHPKPPKYKASKRQRPPSPVIPADAPPWVRGRTVVTVHRDANTGEVYLTEKNR